MIAYLEELFNLKFEGGTGAEFVRPEQGVVWE